MKRNFIYIFALAATIGLASCSGDGGKETDGADSTKTTASAEAPAAKKGKYNIKSGIITYDTEAMGMKMPTTLYFDDYGNIECQEVKMEMEMMGTKVTTHNLTITKDGYIYTIDLTNKTGSKMKMMPNAATANMSGMDFTNLSEEFLKSMKMKKEGSESVCGKSCDVYSIDNESMGMKGTFAIYNSIPMKTNIEAMGMPMTMNATKFEENVEIPADKFEVPADIQVTEM